VYQKFRPKAVQSVIYLDFQVEDKMDREGGRAVQTLREILEGLDGRNPTRLTFAAYEARKSEEALRAAQEVSNRKEQRSREAEKTSERVKQQGLIVMESSDGRQPTRYWQKTKIIVNHTPVVGGPVDSNNLTEMVQDSGESTFYTALGTIERARVFNSLDVGEQLGRSETRHRIRTLTEFFETSHRSSRKRARPSVNEPLNEGEIEELSRKRARIASVERSESVERTQAKEAAAVMRALEEEFQEKERQSQGGLWCEPISHERKVATVCEFYKAFHDARTMPIQTCTICYRKFAAIELEEFESNQSTLAQLRDAYGSQFGCGKCFTFNKSALGCAECIRHLEEGALSPAAHVHNWLRCEHAYPAELKDLSPVEEKLIALNSCYGFITKYNVVKGHRESATYPKHVKGHITVFPNNVQELVTRVLPHPLLQVMDEIHVSWQGAEKPTPKDLSILLSVRRRSVEKALVWLKRNNPHYANIEIDTAEMETWGTSCQGVPALVYERLERDEP
jgi:hypothetical protein